MCSVNSWGNQKQHSKYNRRTLDPGQQFLSLIASLVFLQKGHCDKRPVFFHETKLEAPDFEFHFQHIPESKVRHAIVYDCLNSMFGNILSLEKTEINTGKN